MKDRLFLPVISRFISATEMEDLPAGSLERAKLVLIDCLGAIVGGMAEPDMQKLATMPQPAGSASILGTNMKTDSLTAALLNGMAGTVLEMDEGSQLARGHPGMHVFPALLAAAEDGDYTERSFFALSSSAMTLPRVPASARS